LALFSHQQFKYIYEFGYPCGIQATSENMIKLQS